MKVKRKPDPKTTEPQKFAVGETCRILRPHLWSDCVGEVVLFKDGLHRVRINAKADGSTTEVFHTDVPGSQLEGWI